jgi:hypothetical protein
MKDAGEKAMALVDGQLAPAEVPGLVQELARNPSLIGELQAYLALSRSRVASAFAAKSEEPVPAWLADTVMRGSGAAHRPSPQIASGASILRWLQAGYRVPAWSLAAAPAAFLLLAVLTGSLVALHTGRGNEMVVDLSASLEGIPSGKDAAVATVRPVLSFASKTAGWCRQVEVRHAARQASHVLACRGDDRQWSVVSSTPPGPVGFTPASADRRKAIDDLAASMMRGNPLSPAEEAALIARRWPPQ